jgi:lysophospholipase L1-like esterase
VSEGVRPAAPRSGSSRRKLGRAALTLLGLLLALCLGESALRLSGAERTRFVRPRYFENADKTAGVDAYPSNPRGTFELQLQEPSVQASLATRGLPSLARASAQLPFGVAFSYTREGCRDREPPPRTPGVPRVLVVGDSFTEGQGVRARDVFPRALERRLGDERVEVFNCGRRGRDFPELRTYFPSLLARHAPDLVVYAMLLNDPLTSPEFRARQQYLNDWILDRRRMVPDAESQGEPWWSPRLVSLSREAYEAVRVSRETRAWYADIVGPPNARGWRDTQRLIAEMDALSRAQHSKFIVVLLPLLHGLDTTYPFVAANAEIGRAMREQHVEFHDLLPALAGQDPRTLWVHPVDLHPNERAHALLGAALEPIVRRGLASSEAARYRPAP